MTDKWFYPLIFPDIPEEEDSSEDLSQSNQIVSNKANRNKDLQETPLNSYFDENGFNTRSLIKNLGSTFIYMMFLVLILGALPILKFFED